MLSLPILKSFIVEFFESLSMLQSLIAPVMSRVASVWIDSSVLDSTCLQLSHTESLYSITGLTNEL